MRRLSVKSFITGSKNLIRLFFGEHVSAIQRFAGDVVRLLSPRRENVPHPSHDSLRSPESLHAVLCHATCVCGWPWSHRNGGPAPPFNVSMIAPDVGMSCSVKPGNNRRTVPGNSRNLEEAVGPAPHVVKGIALSQYDTSETIEYEESHPRIPVRRWG